LFYIAHSIAAAALHAAAAAALHLHSLLQRKQKVLDQDEAAVQVTCDV